jgi:hypothetical protein
VSRWSLAQPGSSRRGFRRHELHPPGTADATSIYDTNSFRATLERLIDFDRINAGGIRFSIGAVNVRSGNFVYFDTKTHTIAPQHIMASGASRYVSVRAESSPPFDDLPAPPDKRLGIVFADVNRAVGTDGDLAAQHRVEGRLSRWLEA